MLAVKQVNFVMSPDQTETARLRRAIGLLSRRLRRTPAAGSLTPTELSVLLSLAGSGPLGLAELGRIERLNPTLLSRVIAKLAAAGLVTRSRSQQDRRAGIVDATRAGRHLRKQIQNERNDALAAQLVRLAPEQRAALTAALPVLEQLAELLTADPPR